jgi:hypothetical protein
MEKMTPAKAGEIGLIGGEVDDGVAGAELALELVGPEFAGVLAGAAEVGRAADEDEGFARGHGMADVGDELGGGGVKIALGLDGAEEAHEIFEQRALADEATGVGACTEGDDDPEEKRPRGQRGDFAAEPVRPAVDEARLRGRCERRGRGGLRRRHR